MSASDHLSQLQFEHVESPLIEGDHTMFATMKDRPESMWDTGSVGHLTWDHDTISDVFVRSDYRRRGVATELLRRAREVSPGLHHNVPDEQTDAGQAWAKARP